MRGFNEISKREQEEIKVKITELIPPMGMLPTNPRTDRSARPKNSLLASNQRLVKNRKKIESFEIPRLKIMYTNADQLTNSKLEELKLKARIQKPLIIAVCEVNSKHAGQKAQPEFDIPGYFPYHVNLDQNKLRGIIVYVKNELNSSVLEIHPQVKYQEVCTLEIRLRGGDTLLFACCYRSPTPTETSDSNNAKLLELLVNLSKKKYSHCCIVGDFNLRDIDWTRWSTTNGEESYDAKFLDAINQCFLFQHVDRATRQRGSDKPSLLDLILTNETGHISDVNYDSPLGKSDHSTLVFDFHCYYDFSMQRGCFNYHKGDYESMRGELDSSSWNEDFVSLATATNDVEELWLFIKKKLLELRDKYVPYIKPSAKPKWIEKGCIPLDAKTREVIREKRKKHRLWMRASNGIDRENGRLLYVQCRNKAKTAVRKSKRKFEKEIASKSKTQPSMFWAHTRRKLKTKSGVSPLLFDIKDENSIKHQDKEKADILQKQFCSVFTEEPPGCLPDFQSRTNQSISDIEITRAMVSNSLKDLNPVKSCGPDDLHPRLLKELALQLSDPVAILMNISIKQGVIPNDWKNARITPIFKKGSRKLAENYRPISLTAVLCKLMESFIRKPIMDHLINNQLLSVRQYGFISGRSTTTQLLYYLDKCVKSISIGEVVDVIYFDFAKAFDTVPHRRLLWKLAAYGIKGKLLDWITKFLTDRNQVVVINGTESENARVVSGIPQGTVLGPLLFVIYINDLLDNVKSNGLLFADDTKIFRSITCKEDALSLQADIHTMENWSDNWLLNFHSGKCHVLTLGKLENIRIAYRYIIQGQEIEHVFSEKDLGVYIDSELTFDEHVTNKVRIANALLGQIRRSFSYLDSSSFAKLFKSFVRPHLEFSQSVWAPRFKKHIKLLENVQERGTKLVDGFQNLTYNERLRRLKMTTLAYRRMRGDTIEVYKHFHVYDRRTITDTFSPRERVTRRHRFQLREYIPSDGTRGVKRNSFYYRSIRIWNDLPANVVDAESLNEFKNRLDDFWANHPLKLQLDEE